MLDKRILAVYLSVAIPIIGCHQTYAADTTVTTDISAEIERRLTNIEQRLESQGLLNMMRQLELLQAEIVELRGEIEVSQNSLDQVRKRQRDLYADVDRRLQAITGDLSNDATVKAATNADPALKTIMTTEPVNPKAHQSGAAPLVLETLATESPSQTPAIPVETGTETDQSLVASVAISQVEIEAEYKRAFKLLKQSLYDQAIKAFRDFIKAHPDNQYSANAQYWMAEALYVKRQYKEAIKEYNNLAANYPDSQKVPEGLLKIGHSYRKLGQADQARLWYIDVRQRFPGTTVSRLASDNLKNIDGS